MLTRLKNRLPNSGSRSANLVEEAVGAVEAAEPSSRDAMRDLVSDLHYEIVPMKSIDQAIADLPAGAHVSVTCSPVKGIAATLEYTEQLLALGHRPVPHFAARLVEGTAEADDLARWVRDHGLAEVFVIAGDAVRALPAGAAGAT